ncbi:MAG TPA: WD40 repeat domain-containing protein [Gemmataceae bacterium]|nr:WD40 repeat domain-containing protein [Gemmataceae bacterium]
MFRAIRWIWIFAALLGCAGQAFGQGYWNETSAVFFMPDGKTAIAACLDEKVRVYDVATSKETSTFEAHKDGVWSAVLSPDGKVIATGGGDNLIKIWDAKTFKLIRQFEGHTKEVLTVAFSPDGKTLASGGGDRTIRTWDVATAKQKKIWHGHELKVMSVAYSPDGKTLASAGSCSVAIPGLIQGGSHADEIKLFDAETGKEIRKHTQHGTMVCFMPDGRGLAAAGYLVTGTPRDGTTPLVSRGTKAILGPWTKDAEWFEMKSAGGTLALSSDGRLMALAGGSRLNLAKGMGKFGNRDYEIDATKITVYETATGHEVLKLGENGATTVAFSPDGKKLAAGLASGQVEFFDLTPPEWPYADKAPKLGAKDLEKLWVDLADEKAEVGYAAVWTLCAAGKPAVAYFKEKLQPEKTTAGDQIKDLLDRLDNEKYQTREAAFGALKKLGSAIETELRLALADDKTSPEVRKRLQKLLDSLDKRPASSEELRYVRALQVLERIGTTEARAVLTALAGGAPGSWLTQQAQLAVKRLESR